MSKLSAIQERIGGVKDALPPTENFALQVSGYIQDEKGRPAVTGLRLDTGEEVTVVLRSYRGPLKAPRAEMQDFIAHEGEISTLLNSLPTDEIRKQVLKGIKAKTEPGGTILVQRAYTERATGIINAGWLLSAAKYGGHCQVISDVMLRINPVVYIERQGKPHAHASATALMVEQSQKIQSTDELSNVLDIALAGVSGIQSRPVVLVRLSDGEISKAIEYVRPIRKNQETNEYTLTTPGEATTAFLSTNIGKQVVELIDDPKISVEVIPGHRINLGPQTKASFENSVGGLEQINRAYRFVNTGQDETGFARSYLVLHSVRSGSQVFSAAEPLSNKPSLFHARDVNTPHFATGKPTVTVENKEMPQPSEPSLEAADTQDVEFEIDDVVGAHLPAATAAPSASRPPL